jgi:hypothetical protein
MLAAVRRNQLSISIKVRADLIELIESLFDIWEAHAAAGPVFLWTTETDTDQVEHLVDQWLEIGSLGEEELARIGVTWAPPHTRPVADALVAGATTALLASEGRGPTLARRLNQ